MKEDTAVKDEKGVEGGEGDGGTDWRKIEEMLTMDWAGKKERICLFDFWDRYKDKKSERERE